MQSSGEIRKANHTYQIINKTQAVVQNQTYDMVNGDKDNGFNGFLDDLSTVHKEKSDLVLNGSDSKTTEVEGYYNDPFKSLHLGDNLKNLQKEKRKRGRPPKMNNTRRNALNLSMEAKNTFDEISSLGDSSNELNESFDDSNNSFQKEKKVEILLAKAK